MFWRMRVRNRRQSVHSAVLVCRTGIQQWAESLQSAMLVWRREDSCAYVVSRGVLTWSARGTELGTEQESVSFAPRGDRLVIFWTDSLVHEVAPSTLSPASRLGSELLPESHAGSDALPGTLLACPYKGVPCKCLVLT
eukprot:3094023-Rhodomonas_salina.1